MERHAETESRPAGRAGTRQAVLASQRPSVVTWGNLKIEGWSRAGEETWFRIHPPGLAFDVGRGSMRLAGARDLFVTHGHLDHALGVPYVLSQRSMHQGQHTRVFCPRELAPALDAFIRAAAVMEDAELRYELVGLEPGDRVAVGKGRIVEAFATDHVVPSLGFHLFATKRRLRSDLAHLSPEELRDRRAAGAELTEEVEDLQLTYLGDTGPRVFTAEPRLFTARVLLLELTFLGDELRDKGERYRHLHFEDLVAQADRVANELVLLHHLSRRHRPADLRRAVNQRLPDLAARVRVMGEP